MLHFSNLIKEYSGATVLEISALTIQNGIVLLKGENGSGKTTLLKIIAGLLPFKGDIIINGEFSVKKQRQKFIQLINYAETEPLYPGFLTAKELVKMFCYAKGGSVYDTEALLKRLHVFDAYKNLLSTYSSGMTKKLSLALAFAGNPKWILLDEPLITADSIAVETICAVIKEKYEQDGISFLLTSHQNFNNNQLSFTSKLLADNHTVITG